MKLEDLESILATVAESCERLDQRLRSAKDAYERMNHLAHQQLWSQPSECQQLELELDQHRDATFGRQLLAPSKGATGKGALLLREAPAIRLPSQLFLRQEWLSAWRSLTPSQRFQLEDFEANMFAVDPGDREHFLLTKEELLELRAQGLECHFESLLHFRQVCRVNAQRLGLGAALFTRASKLTHSCRPNCYTVEDGCLELRSLRDLSPRELLTISYIADEKLLLQDSETRRRYLWRQHCFHCRCDRCEGPDLAVPAPRAVRLATAPVERWRRLERRVGNLLKPELEGESWSVLWRELMIWQTEASEALPSEHWATVHAALLASYLAMRRHSQGFPLPLSVARILQGFSGFLQLHQRLCPEVWWLTDEVQVQLQELRLLLSRDLDVNMAPLLPAALVAGELELLMKDEPDGLNGMD